MVYLKHNKFNVLSIALTKSSKIPAVNFAKKSSKNTPLKKENMFRYKSAYKTVKKSQELFSVENISNSYDYSFKERAKSSRLLKLISGFDSNVKKLSKSSEKNKMQLDLQTEKDLNQHAFHSSLSSSSIASYPTNQASNPIPSIPNKALNPHNSLLPNPTITQQLGPSILSYAIPSVTAQPPINFPAFASYLSSSYINGINAALKNYLSQLQNLPGTNKKKKRKNFFFSERIKEAQEKEEEDEVEEDENGGCWDCENNGKGRNLNGKKGQTVNDFNQNTESAPQFRVESHQSSKNSSKSSHKSSSKSPKNASDSLENDENLRSKYKLISSYLKEELEPKDEQPEAENTFERERILSIEKLNNLLMCKAKINGFNNSKFDKENNGFIVKDCEGKHVEFRPKKFNSQNSSPVSSSLFSPSPQYTQYSPDISFYYNNCLSYSNCSLMDNIKNIDFSKMNFLKTKNKLNFNTVSNKDYVYKYVCNYDVQIENDDDFMVTKRIIGKNGCFLKKIIYNACIIFGDQTTKIRVRGRGSGYLEGPEKKESDQPLMLSISSLYYPTYLNACFLLEKLLNNIYDDYLEHLRNSRVIPEVLKDSLEKKTIIKNEYIVDRFGNNVDDFIEN